MSASAGGDEGDGADGGEEGAGAGDPSSIAMSDLFSTLFLLLMALLVVALLQLQVAKREHRALAEEIRSRVGSYQGVIGGLTKIKGALERERIQVEVSPESGEVIIQDDGAMFGVREAALSPTAQRFLERFAAVYFDVVLAEGVVEHVRWVVVEGHASVEGEELENLALSAARAHSVAAFLLGALERRALGEEAAALGDEARAALLAGCLSADCDRLRGLRGRLLVAGRGELGARRAVDARDRSVRFRLHFQSDLFDLFEDPVTRRLLLERSAR